MDDIRGFYSTNLQEENNNSTDLIQEQDYSAENRDAVLQVTEPSIPSLIDTGVRANLDIDSSYSSIYGHSFDVSRGFEAISERLSSATTQHGSYP